MVIDLRQILIPRLREINIWQFKKSEVSKDTIFSNFLSSFYIFYIFSIF